MLCAIASLKCTVLKGISHICQYCVYAFGPFGRSFQALTTCSAQAVQLASTLHHRILPPSLHDAAPTTGRELSHVGHGLLLRISVHMEITSVSCRADRRYEAHSKKLRDTLNDYGEKLHLSSSMTFPGSQPIQWWVHKTACKFMLNEFNPPAENPPGCYFWTSTCWCHSAMWRVR